MLVPVEVLLLRLGAPDIEGDVDPCKELTEDVLAISVEFFLPVWEYFIHAKCHCELLTTLVLDFPPLFSESPKLSPRSITGCNSGVLVLHQCSKVDLSVFQDITPEDGREVQAALLRFKVLEGLFDVREVGVLQEMGFLYSGQTNFIKVLPWGPASRFVPVPCIVPSPWSFPSSSLVHLRSATC